MDLHTALKDFAEQEDLPGTPVTIVGRSRVVEVDCEAGRVVTEEAKEYVGDIIVGADG